MSCQLIKPSSLAIPATDTASQCLWKNTPPTQYCSFLAKKNDAFLMDWKGVHFHVTWMQSCNMSAKLQHKCKVQIAWMHAVKIRLSWLFVIFFMYIIGKKKIGFPLQFAVITCIFKDYTLHSPVILLSLNNSLVLINTKLCSKSCYYLHKCTLFTPHY